MRPNVRMMVQLLAGVHQYGPIAEMGSRRVDRQPLADLRPFFPNVPYVGFDQRPGRGVDYVRDMTDIGSSAGAFKTILCCDALEHCKDPKAAIQEMARILSWEEGVVFISVPFNFPIHHTPDYWRFTPGCLDMMLEDAFGTRVVFYQGDIEAPHTVFGFASHDQEMISGRLWNWLSENLHKVPGTHRGEQMYLWQGDQAYAGMRAKTIEESMVAARCGFQEADKVGG